MRPGQVFFVLGQANVVVIGKPARTGNRGSRRHGQVGVHVIHEGGLAASVHSREGNQLRVADKAIEVERQFVAAEAIADAAKPSERER